MGKEHLPEIVWRAQELYCSDRLSFAAVADAVGVADSTVRRWADKLGWRAEREEIARIESSMRAKSIKARARVLDKLLTENRAGDAAQLAYASAALEKVALAQTAALEKRYAPSAPPGPPSSVSQDKNASPEAAAQESLAALPEGLDDSGRVALLEQALDRQLAFVLSHPVEDLSRRVKEIKAAMDVLASLKGKDDSGQAVAFGFEE